MIDLRGQRTNSLYEGDEPCCGSVSGCRWCLLALLPTVASAQFQQGDWELTLTGNGLSDNDFDATSLTVGGSIGYFFTDQIEVGLRQTISLGRRLTTACFNGSTSVFGDYHFDLDRWQPFIGANFGYVYGDSLDDTFVAGPEGGVKYFVNNTTFIFASVQYQFFWDRTTRASGRTVSASASGGRRRYAPKLTGRHPDRPTRHRVHIALRPSLKPTDCNPWAFSFERRGLLVAEDAGASRLEMLTDLLARPARTAFEAPRDPRPAARRLRQLKRSVVQRLVAPRPAPPAMPRGRPRPARPRASRGCTPMTTRLSYARVGGHSTRPSGSRALRARHFGFSTSRPRGSKAPISVNPSDNSTPCRVEPS